MAWAAAPSKQRFSRLRMIGRDDGSKCWPVARFPGGQPITTPAKKVDPCRVISLVARRLRPREKPHGSSCLGSQRASLDANRADDRIARRAGIDSRGGADGAGRAAIGERGSSGDSSRSLIGQGARAPREGTNRGSGQDGERFVARRPVDGGSGERGGIARGTPSESTRGASALARGDTSARTGLGARSAGDDARERIGRGDRSGLGSGDASGRSAIGGSQIRGAVAAVLRAQFEATAVHGRATHLAARW